MYFAYVQYKPPYTDTGLRQNTCLHSEWAFAKTPATHAICPQNPSLAQNPKTRPTPKPQTQNNNQNIQRQIRMGRIVLLPKTIIN